VRPKSMSLTPSRRHSSSRRPAPYINDAQSHGVPCICARMAPVSSRISTTGSRTGRLANGRDRTNVSECASSLVPENDGGSDRRTLDTVTLLAASAVPLSLVPRRRVRYFKASRALPRP